jgi:hypothetical protein
MLGKAFFYVLVFMLISCVLSAFGAIITYYLQSSDMAVEFIKSWIYYFNGIIIGGTGWGVAFFVLKHGKATFNNLSNLLIFRDDELQSLLFEYNRSTSWKRLALLGLPLTLIGCFILWKCGYPLHGFAKVYLALFSMSLYMVGSFMLFYFIFTIRFFMLFEKNNAAKFRALISPMDMDNFNSFFIITSTIGAFAIYFAFRGTLTANFSIPDPFFKKLLIYPIIVYFPTGIMFTFYPRYVLKKINDVEINDELGKLSIYSDKIKNDDNLSIKEKLEIEQIIRELKTKLQTESKQFPLISVKDYPSLTLLILIAIQFIFQKDPVISGFFNLFCQK